MASPIRIVRALVALSLMMGVFSLRSSSSRGPYGATYVRGDKLSKVHSRISISRGQLSRRRLNLKVETSATATTAKPSKMEAVQSLNKAQSLLLLTVISATYGTNFTALKTMGDAGLDPSFSALVRFLIATVLFVPAIIRTGWPSATANTSARLDILAGGFQVGFLNGIGYLLQSFALKQEGSSATTIAFVACLSVVVVPILDVLLSSDEGLNKVQPSKFGPALLALAGVTFLELYGGSDNAAGSVTGLPGSSWAAAVASLGSTSNIAAFFQPLFFGLGFYRLERVIKRCTQPEDFMAFTGCNQLAVFVLSCIWFTAGGMGGGGGNGVAAVLSDGALSEAASLWSRTATQASLLGTAPVMFSLAWTGLITTAGCALFEGIAMKQLTGAEVTLIYSTEPIFATFWAALLLGETVGINTIIGAVLIISACLLSQKTQA